MSTSTQAVYLKIHDANPELSKIRKVTEALKEGAVVIYPTDTVYALGCDLFQPKAIDRISKIKSFSSARPDYSIICHEISEMSQYTKVIPNDVFKLLKKTLPGPYTYILEANNKIPKVLNQNRKTIGVRVPDNKITLALVKELGSPIITTSIKDDDDIVEYPTDPLEIYEHFKKQVDFVIDGGTGGNIPSSVINVAAGEPVVEREGLGQVDGVF